MTNNNTQTQEYRGGQLNRIQAQWVADWLRAQGRELPSGWSSIWKMKAEVVAKKYDVSQQDVIRAANGDKR